MMGEIQCVICGETFCTLFNSIKIEEDETNNLSRVHKQSASLTRRITTLSSSGKNSKNNNNHGTFSSTENELDDDTINVNNFPFCISCYNYVTVLCCIDEKIEELNHKLQKQLALISMQIVESFRSSEASTRVVVSVENDRRISKRRRVDQEYKNRQSTSRMSTLVTRIRNVIYDRYNPSLILHQYFEQPEQNVQKETFTALVVEYEELKNVPELRLDHETLCNNNQDEQDDVSVNCEDAVADESFSDSRSIEAAVESISTTASFIDEDALTTNVTTATSECETNQITECHISVATPNKCNNNIRSKDKSKAKKSVSLSSQMPSSDEESSKELPTKMRMRTRKSKVACYVIDDDSDQEQEYNDNGDEQQENDNGSEQEESDQNFSDNPTDEEADNYNRNRKEKANEFRRSQYLRQKQSMTRASKTKFANLKIFDADSFEEFPDKSILCQRGIIKSVKWWDIRILEELSCPFCNAVVKARDPGSFRYTSLQDHIKSFHSEASEFYPGTVVIDTTILSNKNKETEVSQELEKSGELALLKNKIVKVSPYAFLYDGQYIFSQIIGHKFKKYSCRSCSTHHTCVEDIAEHIQEKHNFVCETCGYQASRYKTLARHKSMAHKTQSMGNETDDLQIKPIIVPVNNESNKFRYGRHGNYFYYQKIVSERMDETNGNCGDDEQFQCLKSKCEHICSTHYDMADHIVMKHKDNTERKLDRNYWIKVTNTRYESHGKWSYEHIPYSNPKEFKCLSCNIVFYTHKRIRQHIIVVHKPKTHRKQEMCPTCGKVFTSSAIHTHLKTHEEIKQFKCEQCHGNKNIKWATEFRLKQQLDVHIARYHSTDSKFDCKICGKVFKTKPYLLNHLSDNSHGDGNGNGGGNKSKAKRPAHKCPICSNVYTLRRTMMSHAKKEHPGEIIPTLNTCPVCKQRFGGKAKVEQHVKDLHPEYYQQQQKQQEDVDEQEAQEQETDKSSSESNNEEEEEEGAEYEGDHN